MDREEFIGQFVYELATNLRNIRHLKNNLGIVILTGKRATDADWLKVANMFVMVACSTKEERGDL